MDRFSSILRSIMPIVLEIASWLSIFVTWSDRVCFTASSPSARARNSSPLRRSGVRTRLMISSSISCGLLWEGLSSGSFSCRPSKNASSVSRRSDNTWSMDCSVFSNKVLVDRRMCSCSASSVSPANCIRVSLIRVGCVDP